MTNKDMVGVATLMNTMEQELGELRQEVERLLSDNIHLRYERDKLFDQMVQERHVHKAQGIENQNTETYYRVLTPTGLVTIGERDQAIKLWRQSWGLDKKS